MFSPTLYFIACKCSLRQTAASTHIHQEVPYKKIRYYETTNFRQKITIPLFVRNSLVPEIFRNTEEFPLKELLGIVKKKF